MKKEFTLVFHVEPKPKLRARSTVSGAHYTPGKTRCAEAELKWLMHKQWGKEALTTPLALDITFFIQKPKSVSLKRRPLPAVKPDLDNFCKLLTDAGNRLLWFDDSQICDISARKRYSELSSIVLKFWEL